MKKLRFTCVLLSFIMLSSLLFNSCAQKSVQDTQKSVQDTSKKSQDTPQPRPDIPKPRQFTQKEIKEKINKNPVQCIITEGTYIGTKKGIAVFKVDPKWGCDFKFKKEQVAGYNLTPNKKYILYVNSYDGFIFEKELTLNYIQNSGEITLDDKISFLKHFEVFENLPNKELKMSKNITRAEFIAMIIQVNTRDYPSEAPLDPDGLLKYQDMVIMTVRAVADFSSEHPNDYLNLAKSAGLVSNTDNTGYATLKDVFEIFYNCYDTQYTVPYDITTEKTRQLTQKEIKWEIHKNYFSCPITEGTYKGIKKGFAVFKVDPKWGCDFKFKKEQVANYNLTRNKKYNLYLDTSETDGFIHENDLVLENIQNSGEITLDDKITFLKHFGVFKNYPNKKLEKSKNITRAEFIAMITQVRTVDDSSEIPMISDISGHWAESYIKDAFAHEIVKGATPVKFDPDGLLKYQDMVDMTVRAVVWDYPNANRNNCLNLAKAAGLVTNTDKAGYATLKDVCEIIYNCFDTEHSKPYDLTKPHRGGAGKPVIYLYPEKKQEVSVSLELDGELTFTYPQYPAGGWNVTASPDGTITCDGREYSYLFWEGTMPNFKPDFSKGFIVAREDTVPFLQKVLSEMGLTPREYNEFIVYWAPILSKNAYNKITFDTEQYEKAAKLKITPQPDSMLRVYMVYEPAKGDEVLPPQTFQKFERKGFTVVEWGGRRMD